MASAADALANHQGALGLCQIKTVGLGSALKT